MFLLSFSTLSRVSSLARLRCDVEETQVITFCSASIVLLWHIFQDSLIVPFGSLEKQGRPSNVRGHIQVPRNFDNSSLCPVQSLLFYLRYVSTLISVQRIELSYLNSAGWKLEAHAHVLITVVLVLCEPSRPRLQQDTRQVDDHHPRDRRRGHFHLSAAQQQIRCSCSHEEQGAHP